MYNQTSPQRPKRIMQSVPQSQGRLKEGPLWDQLDQHRLFLARSQVLGTAEIQSQGEIFGPFRTDNPLPSTHTLSVCLHSLGT